MVSTGLRLGIAGPSSGPLWRETLRYYRTGPRSSLISAKRLYTTKHSRNPGGPRVPDERITYPHRIHDAFFDKAQYIKPLTTLPFLLRRKTPLTALSFIPTISLAPDSPLLTLFNPFAKLILASPLPSYGLTIILFTLTIRLGLTAFTATWQKSRMDRLVNVVAPQLRRYNDKMKVDIMKTTEKSLAGYEDYTTQLKKAMRLKAKELHSKHSTTPNVTNYLPMAWGIPTVLFFSMTIRRAMAIEGSELGIEVFGFGDLSIVLGEPSLALACIGSMLMFGNAEVFAKKNGDKKVADGDRELMRKAQQGGAGVGTEEPVPVSASLDVVQQQAPVQVVRTVPPPPPRALPAKTMPKRNLSTIPPLRGPNDFSRRLGSKDPSIAPPPALRSVPLANTQSRPASGMETFNEYYPYYIRAVAIGFVFIGSQIESGVVLYWVSSLAFTFGWQIHLLERGRRKRKEAMKAFLEKGASKV